MTYYFIADIGGTNARFGCVRNDRSFRQIEHPMTFHNKDFNSVSALIHHYFKSIGEYEINDGCVAVAGPVADDQVSITNLGWSFSINELRKQLQIAELVVMNDFVSLAYSLPHLLASDLTEIIPGKAQENGTKIVLGPGTGLGAAALIVDEAGHRTVVSTEAGHIGFAPGSELEIEILRLMQQESDYVPIEDLVSGAAFPTLYKVLANLLGKPAEELTAVDITRRAMEQDDPLCTEVLSLFCSMLASFAGDMALCFGATGGIYLGGGLLPKLELSVIVENFSRQFRNKGRMSHILADVPVVLINPRNAALIGASSYYQAMMSSFEQPI